MLFVALLLRRMVDDGVESTGEAVSDASVSGILDDDDDRDGPAGILKTTRPEEFSEIDGPGTGTGVCCAVCLTRGRGSLVTDVVREADRVILGVEVVDLVFDAISTGGFLATARWVWV